MTAEEALAALRDKASDTERAALARYGIPDDRALGVAMRDIKAIGTEIGRDHALAKALWRTGIYEARTLAAFVDVPAKVDGAQMDRWAGDFDTWAICDTVCFHLFDRAAPAWDKVHDWSEAPALYTRRASLALIWALSVHDKTASDEAFLATFPAIARAAAAPEPHVLKGASMALRAVGKRNVALHHAALELAETLVAGASKAGATIGRETLRDLTGAPTQRRLGLSSGS